MDFWTRSLRLAVTLGCLPVHGCATASLNPKERTVVLSAQIMAEALPLMTTGNYLALGSEAARLDAWVGGRVSPFTLRLGPLLLVDAAGERTTVSPTMARTMTRLNQWYGLVATADHLITHKQLQAATLSPASVGRIQTLFEQAIGRGLQVDGQWITPEAGGEATIDRELRLVELSDARWSMVQELARMSADPETVASYFETHSQDLASVDLHGLLKVAVARLRLKAPGAADEIRRAVATVALNAAPTFTHDPEKQFALIASRDWTGRYVGLWHTHAPHFGNGEWSGGDVPSFEDMQNAIAYGQYLTLSFQPDGFDLYDAEPLAEAQRVDLTLMKVIRYRSPLWRDHFRKRRPASTSRR